MKNIIKISCILLLISFGTHSFAQTFGINAGLNLSNLLAKDNDENYSNDFKMNPGFHVGATVNFSISKLFSLESGLSFTTKGSRMSEKYSDIYTTYEYKEKLNLYYLDIPIVAKATFNLKKINIYATFGPYIGLGLWGNMKIKYTMNGETNTNKETLHFGSGDDEVKRFDYGLIGGAGIGYKAFQFGITYSLGLANMSNYTDDGSVVKNRVLGISAGYMFGKNKKPKT